LLCTLDEKTPIYDCGFKDPSGKSYYKIKMNTQQKNKPTDRNHTISISYNDKKYGFVQNYSKFNKYDNKTKQIVSASEWSDVTLVVALISAFDNISIIMKNNNIDTFEKLINNVKNLSLQLGKKSIIKKNIKQPGKDEKLNIIQLFYQFSLFKGLGDISQEMTAVIKFGGYGGKDKDYKSGGSNLESFDTNGNAFRFFLAGDILSANRFILTLNYGLKYSNENQNNNMNNINIKSYGGFLHNYNCNPSAMYLVERNNTQELTGGNKYKKNKTLKIKKKYFKHKRNKHYTTYKLYKKNKS